MYKILQWFFPNIQFLGDKNGYYLTIDDSPSKYTTDILDILDQYQIKATFFCIGQNIEQYQSAFQEIVTRGHAVGFHSYGHLNAWRQRFEEFRIDFERTETLFSSTIYRPPYGKLTWRMLCYLKKKRIRIVLWNILTEDWKKLNDPEKKIQEKLKNAPLGSIFVFHDNEKSSENVKIMLSYFLQKTQNEGIDILNVK